MGGGFPCLKSLMRSDQRFYVDFDSGLFVHAVWTLDQRLPDAELLKQQKTLIVGQNGFIFNVTVLLFIWYDFYIILNALNFCQR